METVYCVQVVDQHANNVIQLALINIFNMIILIVLVVAILIHTLAHQMQQI